uniref:Biotin-protein ligase N-terminal domain-containing protein n=1 Tax=Spongospora subterranea TaxID=70186 RepID=A0A0H5QGI3_9EUKA|eukprot:CRZ01065.1 hypothetical protein [Spongospora subterranea]
MNRGIVLFALAMAAIVALLCFSLFGSWSVSKPDVLVYSGEGTRKQDVEETVQCFKAHLPKGYNVKEVSAKYLRENDWESTSSIVIIPGGRDKPFTTDLSPVTDRIRKFVENGGNYIGIGAGAYFASNSIDFQKDSMQKIVEPRELKLINGKAVNAFTEYEYDNRVGARTPQVHPTWDDDRTFVFYCHGGSVFELDPEDKNMTVLAELDDGRPVIVLGKVGAGKALVSGVHFEYDPKSVFFHETKHEDVVKVLHQNEHQRAGFIRKLLEHLKL